MSASPPTTSVEPGEPRIDEVGVEGVSIKRRALVGVALVGMRGLAIRALGFLSSLILARLLTPDDFGTLAFGQTFIGFAALLGDVGIAAALLRRPSAPTRRELQAVLAFQLGLVLLTTAIVVAVALSIGGRTGGVTALIVCSMPIAVSRTPTTLRLERDLSYGRLAFAEVLETLVYVMVAVGSTLLGAGVWGVSAAIVVKVTAGTSYLLLRDHDRVLRPRWDGAFIRTVIAFGFKFQLTGALMVLRGQGVNLVTGSITGLSVLGVWSLSERLMQVPFLLFDSLSRVTMPAIARLLEAGEDPVADVRRSLGVGTVLTGALLVGLSATAPLFVPALFGPEWNDAADVIPLASIGLVLVGPTSACCGGLLLARGDAGTIVRATLWSMAAWAVVSFPLLASLGPVANGLGWLASSLAETVVLIRALRSTGDLRIISTILPPGLVAAAVAGAGLLVAHHLPATLIDAIWLGSLTTAAYLAVLFILRRDVVLDAWGLARRSFGMAVSRA